MRKLLFFGLAVLLLIGLFVLLRPELPTEQPTASTTPAQAVIEFVIEQGKLAAGPASLKAHQGDTLRLRIVSDQADHWHLHGYDLELHLKAAQPAEITFTADRTGRFEHELHHNHLALGVLEVVPR